MEFIFGVDIIERVVQGIKKQRNTLEFLFLKFIMNLYTMLSNTL